MVYLITYDLNREINRPPIVTIIKELGAWACLSESSYAIETASTVTAIYRALAPLLDSNDSLLVVTLRAPWTGHAPAEVMEWLHERLA